MSDGLIFWAVDESVTSTRTRLVRASSQQEALERARTDTTNIQIGPAVERHGRSVFGNPRPYEMDERSPRDVKKYPTVDYLGGYPLHEWSGWKEWNGENYMPVRPDTEVQLQFGNQSRHTASLNDVVLGDQFWSYDGLEFSERITAFRHHRGPSR